MKAYYYGAEILAAGGANFERLSGELHKYYIAFNYIKC
jgi:hypothetical protein